MLHMHPNSLTKFEYLKLISLIINDINNLLHRKYRIMSAFGNQMKNHPMNCLVKQELERKLKMASNTQCNNIAESLFCYSVV